jgi:hypothetical protein
MDRHFTLAGAALYSAAKAIEAYDTECVKDVSVDGDNDSAEIIFSVNLEGTKKTYILKLVELDDPDAEK